jgi:hypothetical protein
VSEIIIVNIHHRRSTCHDVRDARTRARARARDDDDDDDDDDTVRGPPTSRERIVVWRRRAIRDAPSNAPIVVVVDVA